MFGVFGKVARYQGRDIVVVIKTPSKTYDFSNGHLLTGACFIDVMQSDVRNPKSGEIIDIGTDKYKIYGSPEFDKHNLVWKLTAVKI